MYTQTLEQKFQTALFRQVSGPDLEDLARELGKTYPTLMRELNPWDKKAKLGLATACEIVRITGSEKLMRLIIEEAGMSEAFVSSKNGELETTEQKTGKK